MRNRSEIEAAATGDFDEVHYDGNVTLGKRSDLFENAGVNLGYRVVEVSSYRSTGPSPPTASTGISISPRTTSTIPATWPNTRCGEHSRRFYVTRFGLGTSDVDFARYGTDLRKYVPLVPVSPLRGDSREAWSPEVLSPPMHGPISDTASVSADTSTTSRRGKSCHDQPGTALHAASAARVPACRHTPSPMNSPSGGSGSALHSSPMPAPPGFAETKLLPDSFLCGYGGGIHFLLPYGIVARTEYAINNHGRGEFDP